MIKDTVTFIIPTFGRPTLEKALNSLYKQTNPNWKAIVVFDNADSTITDDERVTSFTYNKPPTHGAGSVRNQAIPVVDTEWIAFLDDDDFLDSHYVEKILKHGETNDLIVFSYRDIENGNIQPPPRLHTLVRCNVGISFAIKTEIVHNNNILFREIGGVEDFDFLTDCVNAGAKWIITHEILYLVGHRSDWINAT